MYKRKTIDEYQIHQHTSCGWEEVAAYDNRPEAKADIKAYRENQPEYPVKIIKRRVKL
jgi:hypothetical protein